MYKNPILEHGRFSAVANHSCADIQYISTLVRVILLKVIVCSCIFIHNVYSDLRMLMNYSEYMNENRVQQIFLKIHIMTFLFSLVINCDLAWLLIEKHFHLILPHSASHGSLCVLLLVLSFLNIDYPSVMMLPVYRAPRSIITIILGLSKNKYHANLSSCI